MSDLQLTKESHMPTGIAHDNACNCVTVVCSLCTFDSIHHHRCGDGARWWLCWTVCLKCLLAVSWPSWTPAFQGGHNHPVQCLFFAFVAGMCLGVSINICLFWRIVHTPHFIYTYLCMWPRWMIVNLEIAKVTKWDPWTYNFKVTKKIVLGL